MTRNQTDLTWTTICGQIIWINSFTFTLIEASHTWTCCQTWTYCQTWTLAVVQWGFGRWGLGFGGGGGFTCVTSFDLFLSYLAICCNNRAFLTTKPPRWNDLFYNYSYLTSRPASMVELSCAGDMLMKRVNENSLFTSEIRQGYKINTLEVYTPNI